VSRLRHVGLAVALAALPALVGVAWALDVQVTTVKASAHGPSDIRLIELRPRLRRLVGYRAFRVVHEQHRSCPWRDDQAFVLPGGRALYVTPKAMRDEAVLLHVQLVHGPRALVDTDVRLQNRGVMLIGVERDTHAEDGALLIMLRAEE
jgi:hypothetical protein